MNKSNLDKALDLTQEIFKNIDKEKYNYKDFELIWSIYNIVHIHHVIPHFIKTNNISKKKKSTFHKLFKIIRTIVKDIILVTYSFISMFYLKLFKNNIVGLWTGDFYKKDVKGDFRLGNLIHEMNDNNIHFVEFIRDDKNSLSNTIINMINRKRPAIYYSSLERLFSLYRKKTPKVNLLEENELHRSILKKSMKYIATPKKIKMLSAIFKFLRLKSFICWEFSDRQANLIVAAKLNNIKTIGFMHGAGMRNYMVHEFISEFDSRQKLGPEVMGVWSEWWKEYYLKNSNLYEKVEVSGMMRSTSIESSKVTTKEIKKVLWISEPLVEPEEIIEYLKYLDSRYEVIIKKRPSTNDIFYNKLIKKYPEFSKAKTYNGDIYEAIKNVDIVVGSHSTAVIDASRINKPFLLVNTKKWGNYFEVSDEYFVENVDSLQDKINSFTNQNSSFIENKYFGKKQDSGVTWMIDKLKNNNAKIF